MVVGFSRSRWDSRGDTKDGEVEGDVDGAGPCIIEDDYRWVRKKLGFGIRRTNAYVSDISISGMLPASSNFPPVQPPIAIGPG